MAIIAPEVMADVKTAEVQDFTPIPKGDYVLKVTETGLKNTKDGTGQYISLTFTVMGPKYQGRKVFAIINLINKSMEAQRIGRQQLKSLITASGAAVEMVNDTDQLIGMTCGARVEIEESEQWGAKNRVKRFMKPEAVKSAPITPAGDSFSDAFSAPAVETAEDGPWFAA